MQVRTLSALQYFPLEICPKINKELVGCVCLKCEDEWGEMRERFKKEGLDFDCLKLEDRILQVWRWLVDAESNLCNYRRMLDKLHEQQHEEIEEMENYVGEIQKLAEKKTIDIQSEKLSLLQEKDKLIALMQECHIDGHSLYEQVWGIIEERNKALDDIEILKRIKLSINEDKNVNSESEMLTEIIKVTSENETLRREVTEMSDRLMILEKSSRQLEIDNDRLSFKLSEALAEIEEREVQLGLSEQPIIWHSEPIKDKRQSEHSKCLQEACEVDSRDVSSRDPLSTSYHRELSHSFGANSTPPSLLMSELASFGSPKKLSSLLESCNELARVEEVKKLQYECENLRTQLTLLGEKYNALALKHIHYKAKRKFQLEELRGRLDACECHIETLQTQLSVQRQRLRAEEIFRKQVESDYRRLQEEKRTMAARLLTAESHQREEARELAIVQRKIALLDTANSELVAQLLKLKYKPSLTKSTTCDNMLSSL